MKNRLNDWAALRLGIEKPTRKDIEEHQFRKIKETFKRAVTDSPFYAEHFKGLNVGSMEDFRKLPFTTPKDVCERGMDMLCVGQREISRIVTMETSGTAGFPKRIFFTEQDQQETEDFFHYGAKMMVDDRDTYMIFMPCERPGSIGTLLKQALERSGVKVIPYGLPNGSDTEIILDIMEKEQVTSVVALASHFAHIAEIAKGYNIPMRSVLLSAEYVSEEHRRTIHEAWDCMIYEHYGMTEMGLGCAVQCDELDGFHVRECELYLEIIDPETGEVLPDGEEGEIVFTTLTRKGMPFIRYRTGDWSSFKTEPCACGCILKCISRVGDRQMKKGGYNGR